MAPLPPDPYKTLGVPRFAPVADVRTAYRKLVLTCHPDKVQDPTQKAEKLEEFQKLQHAYELLTDEKERAKYDDLVKLMDLRKEASRNMANTSSPRTPRAYNVTIRTAEPRSSPYAQSPPQAGSRLYAQYAQSPKDEFVYVDDAGLGRSAKRTQSYDKRSSRKEKEWDEDKEREKARRRRERDDERERERERERRSNEKEIRKAEKKRQDKERKHAQEEKIRHVSPAPYVEDYSGDGEAPKSEKKKSNSRKHRDRERERESTPNAEVFAERTTTRVSAAESYIKSRGGPTRSSTFDPSMLRHSPPSVPTPPPPRDSPYPAPPAHVVSDDDDDDEEEEIVHRSRGAVRRGSYDPPRSKDRVFLHKRSFPSVVDEHLSTSPNHLAAMAAAESPPRGSLPKSSTFHAVPRPGFAPPTRSHTYAGEATDPRHPRGRSRSKYTSQVDIDEEEDELEQRMLSRKARGSRREPPSDPIHIPVPKSSSYVGESRSFGRESYRGYGRSKSYMAHSGSSEYVVEPAYSHSPKAQFPKVRTGKRWGPEDVAFAGYPGEMLHEVDAYQ